RLRLAGEQEKDLPCALQHRQAEGDPVDERFQAGLGRQHLLAATKRRRIREQRRDVAVRPDAEQQEVQTPVVELPLVLGGGLVLAELALDPMDAARRTLEPVEEGPLRHAVIRVLVARRDAAFVSPPDVDLAPVGRALRRFLVRVLGHLSAREHDVAAFATRACETFGDGGRDLPSIPDYDELDLAHCSPAASSRAIAVILRNRLRRSLRRAGETTFPPRAPFLKVRLALRAAAIAAQSEELERGNLPVPPKPPPPSDGALLTARRLPARASAPSLPGS